MKGSPLLRRSRGGPRRCWTSTRWRAAARRCRRSRTPRSACAERRAVASALPAPTAAASGVTPMAAPLARTPSPSMTEVRCRCYCHISNSLMSILEDRCSICEPATHPNLPCMHTALFQLSSWAKGKLLQVLGCGYELRCRGVIVKLLLVQVGLLGPPCGADQCARPR